MPKDSCRHPPKPRRPRRYKTNPYIDQLARPRLGLITYKFNGADPYDIVYGCPCASLRTQCCFFGRCRGRRQRPVSWRVHQLAIPLPRKRTCKYRMSRRLTRPPCHLACPARSQHGDLGAFERTPQLALPYARKLVDVRRLFRQCCMDKCRLEVVDKHIQQSLATVYSRLAKVRLPRKRQPSPKWTDLQWSRHKKWLALNALPKDLDRYMWAYDPRFVLGGSKNCYSLVRQDELAQPKRIEQRYQPPHYKCTEMINPKLESAVNYKLTQRMARLLEPRRIKPIPDEFEWGTFEPEFPPTGRLAKITSIGFKALAEPRFKVPRFQKGDNASVVFTVSKGAKEYKPSENIQKMAKPVARETGAHFRENAFAVSKKALSKKPLDKKKKEIYDRLSTPRRITEKFVKKA